jgi:hypothetical protein
MQRAPTHQRRRRDHFSVQQRLTRQQPMQVTAMPVGPIHHRGDGEYFFFIFQQFMLLFNGITSGTACTILD